MLAVARRSVLRRLWLGGMAMGVSGCVYYNGIYNAKESARRADARLRRGAESEAATLFQTSAAKAETVLVRHPASSWRTRALYLAGRGAALGGQCETAVPRLTDFLALPGSTADDLARARVALASCELRLAKIPSARARLDSLLGVQDPEIAGQVRLWAARAALAAGDRDAVGGYLGDADDGTLPWELLLASLSAREYVRVESLLVQRAARADYREDVTRAMRELWTAGYWDAVESVVRGYDAARIRDATRAGLHFTAGDLNLRAGRDSLARQHLFAARTLAGRDTVIEREASARLAYMNLARVGSLREVDTIMARQDSATQRTPYARRVSEHLLLIRLLAQQDEPTGAATFLAAEVARDSLRAPELARSLFLRVAREIPGNPLAPQAWYAASLLSPDSADAWIARIRRDHAQSAVAAWLAGDDPGTRPDFASSPELLQVRWTETLRVWSDSVRKLRLPPRPTTSSPNPP
jgi:hypothetical protein